MTVEVSYENLIGKKHSLSKKKASFVKKKINSHYSIMIRKKKRALKTSSVSIPADTLHVYIYNQSSTVGADHREKEFLLTT